MAPKKILFCTDFSENSTNARGLAADFAAEFSAELHIIHVIKSSQIGYPVIEGEMSMDLAPVIESIEDSVKSALDLVAGECGKRAQSVETHFTFGHPAIEIVKYAIENQMDLIVTGAHGWTGIKSLLLGSTAENIVRRSTVPVLTAPSQARDDLESGN